MSCATSPERCGGGTCDVCQRARAAAQARKAEDSLTRLRAVALAAEAAADVLPKGEGPCIVERASKLDRYDVVCRLRAALAALTPEDLGR